MTKKSDSAPDEGVAQTPPLPDYGFWAGRDTWTLEQSILLLLNVDPATPVAALPETIQQEFRDLTALATKAAGKTLKYFHNNPLKFLPWDVLEWAENLSPEYPPWNLKQAFMDSLATPFRSGVLLDERKRLHARINQLEEQVRLGGEGANSKYLDPEHPFYSPELAAAVNAWIAIQEDRKPGSPHPTLAEIEKYIEQHVRPNKFGPTVLTRIARVISLSKGGRPKKKTAKKP